MTEGQTSTNQTSMNPRKAGTAVHGHAHGHAHGQALFGRGAAAEDLATVTATPAAARREGRETVAARTAQTLQEGAATPCLTHPRSPRKARAAVEGAGTAVAEECGRLRRGRGRRRPTPRPQKRQPQTTGRRRAPSAPPCRQRLLRRRHPRAFCRREPRRPPPQQQPPQHQATDHRLAPCEPPCLLPRRRPQPSRGYCRP